MVDREFGTGCVKITGAHDFNDYGAALRHKLPLIVIFTLDAKINENGPKQFQGMDRYVARKAVVAQLERENFLAGADPHKMMVPKSGRTGVVVEPMLTDQWFVKMDGLAKDGLEVVARGEVKFFPEHWTTTYNQWLENIQDWCISRQLWWGHQIPAWYDDEGQYLRRAHREGSAGRKQRASTLKRDPDVLDTWFSSAAGAVLLARLAGEDAGPGHVPALLRAGHRQRHHLLLGGAHDHGDAPLHRQGAVPPRLHQRHRARRRGREDVEVQGQHDRSARPDRRHLARRRCWRNRPPAC